MTNLYCLLMPQTAVPGPRTSVCLPSGLYNVRTGRVLEQSGPFQEITPLPGIYFFDGWRVHPTLEIPSNLPSTEEAPVYGVGTTTHRPHQPDHRKRKHVTYLPQRPRRWAQHSQSSHPCMQVPSSHGQPTWPHSRQCTMPQRSMHNATTQQRNHSNRNRQISAEGKRPSSSSTRADVRTAALPFHVA